MKKFLFVFLQFVASNLFAQLNIVKDNLGCGYGLMDKNGIWVLQPDYTLIEPLKETYFVTLNEEGKGLVNLKGKEIIAPKYDWISLLNDSIFSIRKDNFYGIYHLRLGEIIPPEHYQLSFQNPFFISNGLSDSKSRIYNLKGEKITNLSFDYSRILLDCIFLYSKEGEKFYTTKIDLKGTILMPKMEGYYLDFNEFGLAAIGDFGSYNRVEGNAGVINQEGTIITERNYQSIQFCNDKFILIDTNLTAMMDADGTNYKEWNYQFWPIENNSYSYVPECLYNEYVWLSGYRGKVGLFYGLGNELTPPIYDAINHISYSERSSTCFYKIYKNGKSGILNQEGKETIKPEYDELELMNEHLSQRDELKPVLSLFIAKKNNKYGLINELNQVLVPFEYANYTRNGGHYFMNQDRIIKVKINDSLTISSGKVNFKIDSIQIIQFDDAIFDAFAIGKANRTNVEFRQIGVLKKLSYYNAKNEQITYLIHPNNKTRTRISYLEPYQNLAKFHTISGKVGVINFKTGKIILDTIYSDVSLNYEKYNLVWVIKNQGEKWLVFDTNGVKKTPVYFDQIQLFKEPVITSNNSKVGIINTDLTWLLKPNFKGINRISDSMYLVQTSKEKFGVFKPKIGWVMDTIYTEFQYVFNHYLNNWKSKYSISNFGSHPVKDYWYLSKKNSSLLFDQFGNVYPAGTKEFDSIVYYSAFSKKERPYVYFTLKFGENVSEEIAKMPYGKSLYQKLNNRFLKIKPCPFSTIESSSSILCESNTKRSANDFGLYSITTIQWVESSSLSKNKTKSKEKEDSVAYYKIPVQEKYTIAYAGKNSVSVSIDFEDYNPSQFTSFYNGMPFYDSPRTPDEIQHLPDTIFNYYWNGKSLELIESKVIFPNESILLDEIKNVIKSRRDLDLNCNSPTFYEDLIKTNFHISPEGIIFYVANSRAWFNQLLIPKEFIQSQTDFLVRYPNVFD